MIDLTSTQINMVDGKIQSISMWHPINGVWVLVTQRYGDEVQYYVNGVEVFPPNLYCTHAAGLYAVNPDGRCAGCGKVVK